MQRPITRGAAADKGLIFHIFAQDSASTTGAGKASVAFSSWSCRYIRSGEAISGAITPEDITTIGTYAAPTANTNIRIKAVDNTNMIGVYEVQIHLDWVNVTNTCQSITIYLTASGVAVLPIQIPLVAINQQSAASFMTGVNGLAPPTNWNLESIDASGRLDVIKIAGTTQSAGDIYSKVDTEIADIQSRLPAALVSGRIDASVGAMAADVVTAAAIATDAIGANELAASAITEIQAGLSTLDAAGVRTAVGLASANLDTQIAAVQSDTDNIQTRLPAALVGGRIDSSVGAMAADVITASAIAADAIGSSELAASAVTEIQSGLSVLDAAGVRTAVGLATANLDTQLAAIQADTDNLQTRLPAALVSGRIDASVGAMGADTLTAAALAADAVAEIQSGLSTLTAAGVRTAVGLATANLDTQLSGINSKTTNLPASPAAVSDIPTAAVVADAVWDEAIAGHLGAGSTGASLNGAGSAGDPWTTALPGAYGAGTAGKIVGDNINATISSRLASASYTAPLDASGTRAAVGLTTANLDIQLNAIDDLLDTEIGAIKDKTDLIPASPAAVGSAMTLSSGERNSIAAALLDLAAGIESGLTVREGLRLALSALAGKVSGGGTASIVFRDVADTKDRITATVDPDGNRTAITLDAS